MSKYKTRWKTFELIVTDGGEQASLPFKVRRTKLKKCKSDAEQAKEILKRVVETMNLRLEIIETIEYQKEGEIYTLIHNDEILGEIRPL